MSEGGSTTGLSHELENETNESINHETNKYINHETNKYINHESDTEHEQRVIKIMIQTLIGVIQKLKRAIQVVILTSNWTIQT